MKNFSTTFDTKDLKRFKFVEMKWSLGILSILACILSFSQKDTIPVGLGAYVLVDEGQSVDYDSLLAVEGKVVLDYNFYKSRYVESDLMYKITNNKGDGFDSLYGTRNLRPILHGAAYRGGANNYYHKTNKRKNHNPLPLDGMHGLCQEGFSAGVYLYRNNFEESPLGDTCECVNDGWNDFGYYQYDYYDSIHVYKMLKLTHDAATKPDVGPVYLHCWNGWHASGFIAAVILKQFCEFSSWDAVNYWDLGTDGANTSPRYQKQRERIKDFVPYKEFEISDSLRSCLCPPMPENIDSSQLHIEIEHLVIVPEAIPIGLDIVLYNVKFGPGRSTFPNIAQNPDIIDLKKALDKDPNLKIEVGGYTDNSGSYSKNVQISKNRAKFVYDHLIASGYDTSRVSYAGYGPKKPIYSNRYRSTREGNRRIEIKILNKTTHGGDKLVDETIYDDPNVFDKEAIKASYLSYFFDSLNSHEDRNTFIVDSLIFASSSAELPEEGYGIAILNRLSKYLDEHPEINIKINGYTDSSGIAENNQVLSQERAQAIYNYLVELGVDASRMEHKGWGSENPIAPNRYKWGRDINRRIEIEFTGD